MSIFVHFVDAFDKKPQRFLGIVKLTTSKKPVDLHEIIIKHLESKNLDSSCIRFSGLDGTNAMSGEQKGLQRLIRHTAPHSQYLNCRNHRLALCLVHLIRRYRKLLELDGVLLSLLKTFKYSSIKQAIFEQAQEASNLKPLKVLKACTTRWLTNGESCIRILPRLHPLIDPLDVIFVERGDADAKGVRDQLLEPNLLLMFLLLAEVLNLINTVSKCLQASTLVHASITAKVNHLIEKLHIIKDSLSDPQVADSKLKFFNKAVSFLHISGQRNHLGRELRGRDKASQQEPSALIKKFLAEIGYSFVDDLLSEIKEALVVDNPILEAFNIFSMETQSEEYRRERMHILCNHYGDEISDVYLPR